MCLNFIKHGIKLYAQNTLTKLNHYIRRDFYV